MISAIVLTVINWFGVYILVNTIFDRLSNVQIQYSEKKL